MAQRKRAAEKRTTTRRRPPRVPPTAAPESVTPESQPLPPPPDGRLVVLTVQVTLSPVDANGRPFRPEFGVAPDGRPFFEFRTWDELRAWVDDVAPNHKPVYRLDNG